MIPRLNMRRVYLIARRDFLGYIKTWGFWISFLMPFVLFTVAFFAARLDINVDPVRYEAILDETGQHEIAIREYDKAQRPVLPIELPQGQMPGDKNIYVNPPADNIDELKAYLTGRKKFEVDGKPVQLSSLLHIYNEASGIKADYWSDNINNQRLKNVSSRYFRKIAEGAYLESGGLTSDGLNDARSDAIKVNAFDPGKTGDGGQAVTFIDRIPNLVSVCATMLLWLTIFSGAYMLLTSMLEEKLNKLLEMMLSTTRLSEIMIGKLIGVAALTITAMLPYIVLMLAGSVLFLASGVGAAVMQAITVKLIFFFILFLVLGYLFYGALFIAMGSLAESMQDAQTLTTPIMLVLSACVMVIPLSLNSPDSPLLTFATWFPLSAPFAAIARLHLDPPWWELLLSASFLFLMSLLVIWIAGRIFRFGVLSGAGVKGVTDWFKRVVLRRKA